MVIGLEESLGGNGTRGSVGAADTRPRPRGVGVGVGAGAGAAMSEPNKDSCPGSAFLKTKRVILMKRVYYIQVVIVLARGVP